MLATLPRINVVCYIEFCVPARLSPLLKFHEANDLYLKVEIGTNIRSLLGYREQVRSQLNKFSILYFGFAKHRSGPLPCGFFVCSLPENNEIN